MIIGFAISYRWEHHWIKNQLITSVVEIGIAAALLLFGPVGQPIRSIIGVVFFVVLSLFMLLFVIALIIILLNPPNEKECG